MRVRSRYQRTVAAVSVLLTMTALTSARSPTTSERGASRRSTNTSGPTGKLKGGRDVRVVNIRLALEGAELRIGACVHLDLRIAAEAHDPDAVVARPRGEDALHRGELRVLRALNAGGAVGHDDQ